MRLTKEPFWESPITSHSQEQIGSITKTHHRMLDMQIGSNEFCFLDLRLTEEEDK